MLNQELIEEIIYISSKNQYLSIKLIEKIIESIIDKTDIETKRRFKNIFFDNINWCEDVVCTCDVSLGNIMVDYDKLIGQYNNSKTLTTLMSNLDMIGEFYHEVEHLKENSKMQTFSLESLLLSYSNLDLFQNLALEKLKLMKYLLTQSMYEKRVEKKSEKLYLKIYDKIPSERFATINSIKELYNSICNYDNFENKYLKEFNYVKDMYLKNYYMGYEKYNKKTNILNSPLLDYINFLDMPDLLSSFDFYSKDINELCENTSKKFTIEEKMYYGFPVTLKETESLDKKLILTK